MAVIVLPQCNVCGGDDDEFDHEDHDVYDDVMRMVVAVTVMMVMMRRRMMMASMMLMPTPTPMPMLLC